AGLLVLLPLAMGCEGEPAGTDRMAAATAQSETSQPFEYAEVELSKPAVRVDEEDVCWFEVHYKFVKGTPGEHYMLTVTFPGTENLCLKPVAGWQLPGTEGVLKDSIPLQQTPITEYQMVLSEAETPMAGYTDISNVVTGKME
ncbi:MAG: hypothetical protein KDA45_14755, partial [Planctomycetales bacterium]|nr:hypothetical protein [Planctomycetales bacterium]